MKQKKFRELITSKDVRRLRDILALLVGRGVNRRDVKLCRVRGGVTLLTRASTKAICAALTGR